MPKNCVNINYAADVRRFFRFDILEQAFIMEIGSAGTSTGASTDTFSIRRRYFFYAKTIQMLPTSMSGASAIELH